MAPSEYFNEGKKISSWAMTQNKLQQQHLKNKKQNKTNLTTLNYKRRQAA